MDTFDGAKRVARKESIKAGECQFVIRVDDDYVGRYAVADGFELDTFWQGTPDNQILSVWLDGEEVG